MLKLILADDEKIIRESISRLIDWKKLGIELVGVCENGAEAYDMIMDESPDIVMTDIKMPVLDGLDLIKKTRALDENIEFIIFSGYGEFEFAKTAMQYGVRHYLLKPINENQIEEVLFKVREDTLKRKELHRVSAEKELLSKQFDLVLKDQFLVEAVTGPEDFSGTIEKYAKVLPFSDSGYRILYLYYLEERFLEHFIRSMEMLCSQNGGVLFTHMIYVKNTAIVLFPSENCPERSILQNLPQRLSFQGLVTPLSVKIQDHPDIGALLEELVPRLRRYDRILLVGSNGAKQEIYNYAFAFQRTEELLLSLDAIEEGEGLTKLAESFFSSLDNVDLAKILVARIAVRQAAGGKVRGEQDLTGFLEELYGCTQMTQIKTLMFDFLWGLMQNRWEQTKYRDTVSKTLQYVNEHFSDPSLSLKWIAENYLYMNVDYLSKQFVKETGEKFSSYLNRLRMEMAKKLLKNYGVEKIYSVAEQVGCGRNPQYFSQIFKRYTGMTPTAFVETQAKK